VFAVHVNSDERGRPGSLQSLIRNSLQSATLSFRHQTQFRCMKTRTWKQKQPDRQTDRQTHESVMLCIMFVRRVLKHSVRHYSSAANLRFCAWEQGPLHYQQLQNKREADCVHPGGTIFLVYAKDGEMCVSYVMIT
jgi:hypothetical protein